MASEYDFPKNYGKGNGETAKENNLRDYSESRFINRGRIDLPFLVLTVLILTVGVIMVFSASFARSYYETGNAAGVFLRQLIFAVGGVALMMVASRVKPKTIRRYSRLLMIVSVGLLALVLIIGVIGGGSRRWINLGFTTFQPSEITKLAVILYFASMACRYKDDMKTWKYGIIPFGFWLGIIVVLLGLEPHFSAIIIICLVGGIMMYAGGSNIKHLALIVIAGGALLLLVLLTGGYTSERIAAWRDPMAEKLGDGWQIVQSLYAVGSGGLLGLGLGQSIQKHMYLPEEHNDYIFAIVCEELGFVGAVLILLLFALLIIRGYWLALHTRDRYSSLIVIGIMTLLAIQVFLNVAVVTNLIPSTGISLPFFSYGGTALLMQMAEMGIVLGVSRNIDDK